MSNRSYRVTDITLCITVVIVLVLCLSCVSAGVTVGITIVSPYVIICVCLSTAGDTCVPVLICIRRVGHTIAVSRGSCVSAGITSRVTGVGERVRSLVSLCSTDATCLPVVSTVTCVCIGVLVVSASDVSASAGITRCITSVIVYVENLVVLSTALGTCVPVRCAIVSERR